MKNSGSYNQTPQPFALPLSHPLHLSSYFAFLLICHRSSTISRVYPSYGWILRSINKDTDQEGPLPQGTASSPYFMGRSGRSLAVAVSLSFAISYLARVVEKAVGLPGISAAVITSISLLVFTGWRSRDGRSFRGVQGAVSTTSSLFFNVFFAAMGAGARLSQILATGPAMTAFMGITLVAHTLILALGVWAVNRFSKARVGISEMVCASNANIGGPATAAAMATSLNCHHLVVPCTIFGTVGYAAATLLGIAMYRFLGRVG